jgi:formate--tetrahydrofolate ligase
VGIGPHLLEPYGDSMAKIRLDAIDELADRPRARYVVVSAITRRPRWGRARPRPLWGSGTRSGTSASGATIAIRQPSKGPTFGIKGGAAGGGYNQVVPM